MRKRTGVVGTHIKNEELQNSLSGRTVGTEGLQQKAKDGQGKTGWTSSDEI